MKTKDPNLNKKKNKKSFLHAFLIKLKEDKLFLLSFIITVAFFGISSFNKIDESEGAIIKKTDIKKQQDEDTEKTPKTAVKKTTTQTQTTTKSDNNEAIDVSEYVGTYKKTITLNKSFTINNICTISSYNIVYKIEKNNHLTKYFNNDCLGTIKLWEEQLKYNLDGGVKYLSSHNNYYRFKNDTLQEIKNDIINEYKIQDDLYGIKENKKMKDVDLYFYDNNIIFLTNDDLLLVKNNELTYKSSDIFINNGGDLIKRYYKSDVKNQFNYIVFSNNENKSCYDNSIDNSELYKIYIIKYNEELGNFDKEKEIIVRNKNNSCQTFNEDMEILKK